jgi:hypothetical protein
MTDKPSSKDLLPSLIDQNPAPDDTNSQDRINAVRSQVDRILSVFLQLLPSNYVSTVPGPAYTLQYQAIAERIADFQVTAQEVFADSAYDYTRSEFLYRMIGALVFPDAQTQGYPEIDGDLSYREFLRRMIVLLLQGSTAMTLKEGVELLTDADVEVIERAVIARSMPPGSTPWSSPENQHVIEINVSEGGGTRFPEDPFRLQRNVLLVLRALKPAHVLYDYRHLMKDSFGPLFEAEVSYQWQNYYYDDLRRYWYGARSLTGTAGVTRTDRTLFSDATRSFYSIRPGCELTVLTGPNSINASVSDGGYVGRYRVVDVLTFPVSVDNIPRPYTTSPSGGSGTATVNNGTVEDPLQNWASFVEGEILTFTSGPNAGSYRLSTVLGNNGGPLGTAPGPGTRCRVSPGILRVTPRMRTVATGQSYEVTVDRLGVQTNQAVLQENVSMFFLP